MTLARNTERLVGDTSRFAIRLAFAPDPDDGRAAAADVSRSWGSFQLWVEGRNLCAHSEDGERVQSVHWYLLPLMEWFAEHWNPLLHEGESLRNTRSPPAAMGIDMGQEAAWEEEWHGWWSRHALRAASDGGLFPDVVFRRVRDAVEVSWGDARSSGMPAGFSFVECSPRAVRLPPAEVALPLHKALVSASGHLCRLAPESDRVGELARNLRLVDGNAYDAEVVAYR